MVTGNCWLPSNILVHKFQISKLQKIRISYAYFYHLPCHQFKHFLILLNFHIEILIKFILFSSIFSYENNTVEFSFFHHEEKDHQTSTHQLFLLIMSQLQYCFCSKL